MHSLDMQKCFMYNVSNDFYPVHLAFLIASTRMNELRSALFVIVQLTSTTTSGVHFTQCRGFLPSTFVQSVLLKLIKAKKILPSFVHLMLKNGINLIIDSC